MFTSYEELMATVEERRADQLTLEVDLGGGYSTAHEEAKEELSRAKALKTVTGDFLADSLKSLEDAVEATRPAAKPVWLRYKRLSLNDWNALVKTQGLTPVDQYDKVLADTFVGVFAQPDATEPLSADPQLVSPSSSDSILSGGAMQAVVQAFMSWQNSGGEVTIHPTKSGQG